MEKYKRNFENIISSCNYNTSKSNYANGNPRDRFRPTGKHLELVSNKEETERIIKTLEKINTRWTSRVGNS